MGDRILNTTIPNEQFRKNKSDLVAFINNSPYTEDMIQDMNQIGDDELDVLPETWGNKRKTPGVTHTNRLLNRKTRKHSKRVLG